MMMHKMERCLQKDAANKSNWHIRFANDRRSLTVEIRTEECDLTSREMPMREVSIASAGGGDSTIDDTQKWRDVCERIPAINQVGLFGSLTIENH